MSSDIWTALEAATHHRKERGYDYCAICSVTWPCTVRRLADAYSAMEQRAVEAEEDLSAAKLSLGSGAPRADERYIVFEEIPGRAGWTHLYLSSSAAKQSLERMRAKHPDRAYEYVEPKEAVQ